MANPVEDKEKITIFIFVLLAVTAGFGGWLVYLTVHQNQIVTEIENESPSAGITRLTSIGTTNKLEILPLVEKVSASSQYQSEHGVSYLVRTETTTILIDLGFNRDGRNPSPLESVTHFWTSDPRI